MTREYDSDRITPENAEAEIHSYLENAQVGSVELIAFSNALEWRKSLNSLHEYRRVLDLIDSGSDVPKRIRPNYGNRTLIESELRVAEVRHALADFEGTKNGSIIPGHTRAYVYCQELIADFEERILKTRSSDMGDPVLSELRGRTQAHDYAMESVVEREVADKNPGNIG